MAQETSSISLDQLLKIDFEGVASYLADYIKTSVKNAGAKGVVVGVSGGVDSATTLALAVKALGPEKVYALIMPDSRTTPKTDVEDARNLVKQFNIVNVREIFIDRMVDEIASVIENASHIAVGNIRARVRMILLYYFANQYDLLVLGTGDRSEFLIGYFTKYGDGAADLYPIAVLYKTQVRYLAKHLGVPDSIAFKPSAPRLWPGHEAEKELGLSYEQIDLALYALVDLGLSVEEASRRTGLPQPVVEKVYEMHRRSEHKRKCFPTPSLEEIKKRFWHSVH